MTQHSIDEMKKAVGDLIGTLYVDATLGPRPRIEDIAQWPSTLVIRDTVDEVAALRTWQAAALPLLRVLADARIAYNRDGYEECLFCPWDAYMLPKELGHAADCPVTLARALLAESEKKGENK